MDGTAKTRLGLMQTKAFARGSLPANMDYRAVFYSHHRL